MHTTPTCTQMYKQTHTGKTERETYNDRPCFFVFFCRASAPSASTPPSAPGAATT